METIAQAVRRLAHACEDLDDQSVAQALHIVAARLESGGCGQDPMPPTTQDEPPPTGPSGPGTGGGGGDEGGGSGGGGGNPPGGGG